MAITPHGFCGSCYFANADAGGVLHCCFYPPSWQRSADPFNAPPASPYRGLAINWPIVTADNWCGHGADATTGVWYTPDGSKPTS
jgi:hypothetical protein